MSTRKIYKVGDTILLPSNTTLIAVPSDTDGAGELVCDDGKGHKCYFSQSKKCTSPYMCTDGYNGVIFIQNDNEGRIC